MIGLGNDPLNDNTNDDIIEKMIATERRKIVLPQANACRYCGYWAIVEEDDELTSEISFSTYDNKISVYFYYTCLGCGNETTVK